VRARVKGFTTFEAQAVFRRSFVSSYVICDFDLNVCANSSLVFGDLVRIFGYPNIGAHRVSADKQLTMPPQKKSKKNIPAETNQKDHHPHEGNEISFVPEPSNITDQERRAKLEALMKARDEKTTHIKEQPAE
jgi:hypothetical protein